MPTEVTLNKDGRSSWGFQLTGGATFEMPITIFDVEEGGIVDKAGIRLGDIILRINGQVTELLTLEGALDIIKRSGNRITLAITNLKEQEDEEERRRMEMQLEDEEEQHVDVTKLDLKPPQPAPKPEVAQRKCWHPIVLDTNPPPVIEERTGTKEAPHKKIMRDFRFAMDRKKVKQPSPENPPKFKPCPPKEDIENDLSEEDKITMAEQLRSMQRQLAALSALPAVLQQSLSIVNENLSRMLPKEREDVAESYLEYEDEEDYCSERNEEDYTDEVTTEEDSSFREPTPHDYGSLDNSRQEVDQESDPEYEPDPEYESEPEPTQEELEKINKLRKLKELNRVWPWSDNIKPVYKISDRYKVPHSELFSNRIQTLEKRMAERKPKQLKEGRS